MGPPARARLAAWVFALNLGYLWLVASRIHDRGRVLGGLPIELHAAASFLIAVGCAVVLLFRRRAGRKGP